MRKFLSVFLVVCLIAAFMAYLPVPAAAASETSGVADTLLSWGENGLPAPLAAMVAAYDVFEAATVTLAKSVYYALRYVMAFFGF